MSELTPEILAQLRRPFTAAAVKVKPLTKPGSDGKAQAAFYLDSRLVVARLNAVAGAWFDRYRLLADGGQTPALYYPVECALTVCGVTRVDVGQGPSQTVDEKAWKTAYSDAFKRAAVKFEVGAYLYAMGRLRAEVKIVNGKAVGFTDAGRKTLYDAYARWLADPKLNTFGEPLDHGDLSDHETEAAEDPGEADGSAGAGSTPAPDPSPDDLSFAEKARIAQERGAKASEEQKDHIADLIPVLAQLRDTSAEKVTEALVNDYGPLAELTSAKANELIGKLERWKANAEKAA